MGQILSGHQNGFHLGPFVPCKMNHISLRPKLPDMFAILVSRRWI